MNRCKGYVIAHLKCKCYFRYRWPGLCLSVAVGLSDRILSFGGGLFLSMVSLFVTFTVYFVTFRCHERGRCGVRLLGARLRGCGSHLGSFLHNESALGVRRLGSCIYRRAFRSLHIALVGGGNAMVCSGLRGSPDRFRGRRGHRRVGRTVVCNDNCSVGERSRDLNNRFFCSTGCCPGLSCVVHSTLPCGIDLVERLGTSSRCM